jgi:basic membrane protein A
MLGRSGRRNSVLATLLFTDIVGSTGVAEEMGDRRWRELQRRHHQVIRAELRRFGGRELDAAGDGFFARFDTPAAAIRCAVAASDAVWTLGIGIRAGVHIGECEILDGKVSGLNVHVAARTMAEAGAGQVLVTSSVRDLVRGAGFGFADRGERRLKGVDEAWRLFEITSVDDQPRRMALADDEARGLRDGIQPSSPLGRPGVRTPAILLAAAVAVAALGFGVSRAIESTAAPHLAGCMAAENSEPLNDHRINQSVYTGLTDAATRWDMRVLVARPVGNPSPGTWTTELRRLAGRGCAAIVAAGSLLVDPAVRAAKLQPDERYVALDPTQPVKPPPNLVVVRFETDQAAFQAGYLAAGMTRTGTVATFGGIPIPPVTVFMRGFAAGVLYYNRQQAADVHLLGWDPATGVGTYVSDDPRAFGVFGDVAGARAVGAAQISAGADILMPVDGPAGEQAAGSAVLRTKGARLIGVDVDGFYAQPWYAPRYLTSVLKNYDVMVTHVMRMVVDGRFHGGTLPATLANGGVGLAEIRTGGQPVPNQLLAGLDEVRAGIESGAISLDPASYVPG